MILFIICGIRESIRDLRSQEVLTRERITALKYYEHKLSSPILAPSPNVNDHSDWMASVNDDKRLTHLSIPGTHESCARVGGPLAQCQDYSLHDQCVFGVRFFDIRCRHVNDCFMIHHGPIYQQMSFGNDVRDVFIDFLKNHPQETIIMCVKEEHTPAENTRSFEDTMNWYIQGNEQYFYLETGNPTLKEMRGKIVLVRRFSSYISPFGNEIHFRDNAIFDSYDTIHARVQDVYVVGTLFDRPAKWSRFSQILNEARDSGSETDILYLDFGSGTSAFCYPYSVCEFVNPRCGNYLASNPNAHCGILLLDYINAHYNDIPYQIIQRNY